MKRKWKWRWIEYDRSFMGIMDISEGPEVKGRCYSKVSGRGKRVL